MPGPHTFSNSVRRLTTQSRRKYAGHLLTCAHKIEPFGDNDVFWTCQRFTKENDPVDLSQSSVLTPVPPRRSIVSEFYFSKILLSFKNNVFCKHEKRLPKKRSGSKIKTLSQRPSLLGRGAVTPLQGKGIQRRTRASEELKRWEQGESVKERGARGTVSSVSPASSLNLEFNIFY